MYRLTVVAGPNRGSSYPLHEGETTVGRLSVNSIVLNSSDRKSTRLNSSHVSESRMPSSA